MIHFPSRCQRCGTAIDAKGSIGRHAVCGQCGADLHACVQCRFYDRTASRQCREPEADPVVEKDRGNFCDFFQPSSSEWQSPAEDPAAEARRRLEALFQK